MEIVYIIVIIHNLMCQSTKSTPRFNSDTISYIQPSQKSHVVAVYDAYNRVSLMLCGTIPKGGLVCNLYT